MTTSAVPTAPPTRAPQVAASVTGAPAANPALPLPAANTHRNRRRPLLILAAALLLLVSALAGAFAFSSVSTTDPVLAMARTVVAGQVVTAEDLTIVQVNRGSGLATIAAQARDQVLGKRAVTDLPAGSTLTPDSVADQVVPAKGHALVGVLAAPGSAPLAGLVPGAEIELVVLSSDPDQEPDATSGVRGVLVAVVELADGSGVRVDVDVPADQANRLQQLAAAKRLAIVVISQER